jgi:hypothetical protein
MCSFISKLIDISTPAIFDDLPVSGVVDIFPLNKISIELMNLLQKRNGFYAFESALHVFPFQTNEKVIGLQEWNSPKVWLKEYQDLVSGFFFFAEDIFGSQFCIGHDGIYLFDPETAEVEFIASDLEEWAQKILSNYNFYTGHEFAHAWQAKNGNLSIGMRLIPKTPFVAGGSYAVENLFPLDSVRAMQLRASLALQIRDLPDGTQIVWKITD